MHEQQISIPHFGQGIEEIVSNVGDGHEEGGVGRELTGIIVWLEDFFARTGLPPTRGFGSSGTGNRRSGINAEQVGTGQ